MLRCLCAGPPSHLPSPLPIPPPSYEKKYVAPITWEMSRSPFGGVSGKTVSGWLCSSSSLSISSRGCECSLTNSSRITLFISSTDPVATLATLRHDDDDDGGEGANREGSADAEGSSDLGAVDARDAAVDARGEALASLRAELAAHARALHRAVWAADAERARASHERERAETLRATESMGAAKSEALRRRLATRAADREAGERVSSSSSRVG